jgi:hypothetical protein
LKKFYSAQLPISLLGHWFYGSLIFGAPCIFYYQSLVWYIANKDFLPFYGGSLQFRDHFFSCEEVFKFQAVPSVNALF